MVRTLTKGLLASHQADVEDCLRVCGAHLWPEDALRQYQEDQKQKALKAHFAKSRSGMLSGRSLCYTFAVACLAAVVALKASPAVGAAMFSFYLWGKFLFYTGERPAWQTNKLLPDDLYWRDGDKRRLPDPVQKVVDETRMFFPDAQFAVSFIGYDPILHVSINGHSYNALVWDVSTEGTVEIIPPPVS